MIHDQRIKHREFIPGQKVLLFNLRLRLFPRKLKSRWSGPFKVTKVFPYGTIKIMDTSTSNKFKVNGHCLTHYIVEQGSKQVALIMLGDD